MTRICLAILLVLLTAACCPAAEAILKAGDSVAIVGDSITEQKLYSVYLEDYLLMCQPAADVRAMQFGWGGETSWGFAARMSNDMLRFKPSLVTTCFGMNDAAVFSSDHGKRYRESQRKIVAECKQAGVRAIVVGSPGCVDSETYRSDRFSAVAYNNILAEERDISREVARSEDVVFADVFDPMVDVMVKIKAKYGKHYHLAGPDGVHPYENGHLVMAYAFLKALGCTGDIGTISIDLKSERAETSPGHKIVSQAKGTVEVESSKYPFCFYGDPTQPNSTRGVLEFLPFNQDLNRFLLVVKNAPTGRCKVSWGQASKEFNSLELAAGINLAAEFLDSPFSEPFRKVDAQVRAQQAYETPLIKTFIHHLPGYKQLMPDESDGLERIAQSGMRRQQALGAASLAAVTPVRHKITVEPLK